MDVIFVRIGAWRHQRHVVRRVGKRSAPTVYVLGKYREREIVQGGERVPFAITPPLYGRSFHANVQRGLA
ncbi:hypothetical protein ACVS9T_001469, partial [Cronobacter sakazakii]